MWSIKEEEQPRSFPAFCKLLDVVECVELKNDYRAKALPIQHTDSAYQHHHIDPSYDQLSLYTRISHCVDKLNDQTFKLDINHIDLHYCGFGPKSKWPLTTPYLHKSRSQIKLAFIINLSDDYESGVMSVGLREDQQAVTSTVDIGTVIMFPSFFSIDMQPPVKGSQDIILGYCYGPQFK
jgi:hypothetical protein